MKTFTINEERCFQDRSELDFVKILKDGQKMIVPKFSSRNREGEFAFYNEPDFNHYGMIFLASDGIEEFGEATQQEYEDFLAKQYKISKGDKNFDIDDYYNFESGELDNFELWNYDYNYLKTAEKVFENLECYYSHFNDYDVSDQEKIIFKLLEAINLFYK